MGKVLVTGFKPFGKEENNPTERLAREFDGARIGGFEVVGEVLPVSYRKVGDSLGEVLSRERAHVVVATGLWGGRSDITVERVALNVMDARIPDNDGYSPKNAQVVRGGPVAYLSTLPHTKILSDLRRAGIPSTLSYSAGTFICNAALYHLLHYAHDEGIPIAAGFLHVPNEPGNVVQKEGAFGMSRPSMAFDLMKQAVRIAVQDSVSSVRKRRPTP